MYLTICQACHKGRKLSVNNGQKISFIKTIQKRFQLDSTSEKIRQETARLTDEKSNLDETYKAGLDEKLVILMSKQEEKPAATITYFLRDERKTGGSYEVMEGQIRKVDLYERVLVMEDRSRIPLDDVLDIESDIFRKY